MAIARRLLVQGLGSHLCRISAASKSHGTLLPRTFLGSKNIERNFSSAKSPAETITSYGALRQNVLVLDESDKDLGVMKWNQLKSMAILRGLKICCIDENALPHAIYKLMSKKTFVESERKKPIKGVQIKDKSLTINSNISTNDLSLKIEQMMKWLAKNYLINLKITFLHQSNEKKHLEVYHQIIKATSTIARIKEARTTDKFMSFDLVVLAPSEEGAGASVPEPLSIKELKTMKSDKEQPASATEDSKTLKKKEFAAKETKKPESVSRDKLEKSEKVAEVKREDKKDESAATLHEDGAKKAKSIKSDKTIKKVKNEFKKSETVAAEEKSTT